MNCKPVCMIDWFCPGLLSTTTDVQAASNILKIAISDFLCKKKFLRTVYPKHCSILLFM